MKTFKMFRALDATLEVKGTEDAETVLVLWSAGTRGKRVLDKGQVIWEELELSDEACDLSLLNSGSAPFLIQHTEHAMAQIGVVLRAWIEDGLGWAEIKLSSREDVAGIVKDIKDGILRNISVGYLVNEYTEVESIDNNKAYLATKWQPCEISSVAIGFDHRAVVLRENQTLETETIINPLKKEKREMELTEELYLEMKARLDAGEEFSAEEQEIWEQLKAMFEVEEQAEQAEPEIDEAQIAQRAVQAFQKRSKEIKEAVKAAGLTSEYADDLITRNVSMQDASKQIFKTLSEKNQNVSKEVKPMNKKALAEAALLNRINGSKYKVERSNPYKGATFMQIIEAVSPRQSGESDTVYLKRATTSGDLTDFLANVANKVMQATDGLEKFSYHRFAGKQTLKDFRATPIVQLAGVSLQGKDSEGGDYKSATLVDSGENITLEERGILVEISQKAIANDDIGSLKTLDKLASEAGHRDIEKRMFALLNSNGGDGPTLSDSKALFHADHNNTLADQNPDPDGVAAANVLMAAFQDDASEPMDLRTKYIVCGPALEMTARQTASSITAAKSGDVNPYSGELEVCVSSRVASGVWYAVADKDSYAALVYGLKEGMEEPEVSTDVDFRSSNSLLKIELPNAVAAASHKGIVKVTVPAEDGGDE